MNATTTANQTFRWVCPTPCDDDCEAECHEWHQPSYRRAHQPENCPRLAMTAADVQRQGDTQ